MFGPRTTTTSASPRRIAAFCGTHTKLRVTNQPVTQVPKRNSADTRLVSAGTLPAHQNWLPQQAFDLPREQFSRHIDAPTVNLISLIQQAARRMAPDGQAVVRPIGSMVYARRGLCLDWGFARDLDIWVYVSPATLATDQWTNLHAALQQHVFDVFREQRVWVHVSERTGYVYLRDDNGQHRLLELKLANLDWLATGLDYAHLRRSRLWRSPRAAHFVKPRLEWAAHTPYENYYPTSAAQQPFDQRVTTIPRAKAHAGLIHSYGENLAEAYLVATPRRLTAAIQNRRLFFRYTRKLLKKQLLLAVMLGHEAARLSALAGLEALRDSEEPARSTASRSRYLAEVLDNLNTLRTAGAAPFSAWLGSSRPDLNPTAQHPTLHPQEQPARLVLPAQTDVHLAPKISNLAGDGGSGSLDLRSGPASVTDAPATSASGDATRLPGAPNQIPGTKPSSVPAPLGRSENPWPRDRRARPVPRPDLR